MGNTVIHTAQMTGMHTTLAEYRDVHRWIAMRTIPAEYQAAHRWIAIRTIPIPAGYQVVRRLEITAMEEITKAVEAAGSIISLVMEAVIIESQVNKIIQYRWSV